MNARARGLWGLLAGFAVFGAAGWAMFSMLFARTMGQDFMVFHTAANVMARHDVGLLLDAQRFTDEVNRTHADFLRVNLAFHPWVYPPPMLFLAAPFTGMPYPLAYGLFSGGTFLMMLGALWLWGRSAVERFYLIAVSVVCPACGFAVFAGQNSFLNVSVILLGFFLLPRRAFAAGMVLSSLALKPQLALMVPVALLAARQYRAIAGGITGGVLLGGGSAAIWGVDLWRQWLTLMLDGNSAFHTWIDRGRIYGQSVYADMRVIGFGHDAATCVQVLAVGIAAAAVFYVFSREFPAARRLAVFLVAAILAAPHVAPYDAVFVGVACGLVLSEGFAREVRRQEIVVAVAAWATTLINPAVIFPPGVVTPLVLAGFLAVIPQKHGSKGVPGLG